jgi:hypothetical protein
MAWEFFTDDELNMFRFTEHSLLTRHVRFGPLKKHHFNLINGHLPVSIDELWNQHYSRVLQRAAPSQRRSAQTRLARI